MTQHNAIICCVSYLIFSNRMKLLLRWLGRVGIIARLDIIVLRGQTQIILRRSGGRPFLIARRDGRLDPVETGLKIHSKTQFVLIVPRRKIHFANFIVSPLITRTCFCVSFSFFVLTNIQITQSYLTYTYAEEKREQLMQQKSKREKERDACMHCKKAKITEVKCRLSQKIIVSKLVTYLFLVCIILFISITLKIASLNHLKSLTHSFTRYFVTLLAERDKILSIFSIYQQAFYSLNIFFAQCVCVCVNLYFTMPSMTSRRCPIFLYYTCSSFQHF